MTNLARIVSSFSFVTRAVLLGVLVLGLAAPSLAKPKCFPREGRCVQVTVNGQAAVKMTKKERRQLERFETSPYADDATVWIREPVSGELEVLAQQVTGSDAWFGAGVSSDIGVVPLEQVDLDVSRRESSASSVRAGGQALRTERLELNSNVLPAGLYLLRVTLRGSDNWDRATVFLRVE